jgi:hypothetical protein
MERVIAAKRLQDGGKTETGREVAIETKLPVIVSIGAKRLLEFNTANCEESIVVLFIHLIPFITLVRVAHNICLVTDMLWTAS